MSCSVEDLHWMSLALEEAELAMREGEIPVGAVIVRNGQLLSRAHNLCESGSDATAHAECLAIGQACREVGSWRLSDCTLYVTLEPCPMCAGALLASRVSRVVYGAKDPTAGAMGTVLNLPRYPLGAHPEVTVGVLEAECRAILQNFFRQRRK